MLAAQRVAAVGATGIYLARELLGRGAAVRVVLRSRENLDRVFAGLDVEKVPADATDRAAVRGAVEGCDVIVDCIGLPAERMADHAVTARAIVEAARSVGARYVQVSSYWAFLPLERSPLDETHPRVAGNAYIRARRAAEEVMLAAGAAVVHLPDFFGPHVGASSHQGPLADAAAGRPMSWIGRADTVREAVYVPDAMRLVAELTTRQRAFGSSWVFPGNGPITALRLAEIAARHLGDR